MTDCVLIKYYEWAGKAYKYPTLIWIMPKGLDRTQVRFSRI